MIVTRFFYNTETEATAGGEVATNEQQVQAAAEVDQSVEKVELTLEQLKQWGFDSKEQMDEHFAKIKESQKPEEEKKKQAELDEIDFRKYAVEKDLAKVEDFETYGKLTAKEAKDLVWEKHLQEFKEDNPEIEDEAELLSAAKDDFNKTYKLEGFSEKQKERGLAKLSKEAKELISPIESKITKAKEDYSNYKHAVKTYPDFEKTVLAKVKETTPEKLLAYKFKDGEEEIAVEIDLTEEDRKNMAKSFSSNKTFYKFNNEPKDKFEKELVDKMQSWLWVNKKAEITKALVEQGINVGRKKGSDIGAENPFPVVESGRNTQSDEGKSLIDIIREGQQAASKFR